MRFDAASLNWMRRLVRETGAWYYIGFPDGERAPDGRFPFSGLICFESVFGPLARDSVRRGSRCLVVITNDGWFGRTAGPRQHAWLARLRAVECGVPVVRCANNGISFICDQDGRILDWLDLGQRGAVSAAVLPGTARTGWVRWGAWPVAAFVAAWLAVALFGPWPRRDAGASKGT
jgi:apolipoprotein N-acyltransferase